MTRNSRAALAALAVVAAASAAFYFVRTKPRVTAEVPRADTSAMEAEVGAKIESARQAVLEAPDQAAAWGRYAMVLHTHKVNAEAIAAYRHALALEPQARWHHYLSKLLEAEAPDEALTHAAEAVKMAPAHVPARVQKANVLEQVGRLDDALKELEEARARDPQSVAVNFALGRMLLAKGDVDASIEHLSRVLARSPHYGSARALLARALQRKGDVESARAEAEQARRASIGMPLEDPWMDELDQLSVSLLGYLARARKLEAAGDVRQAESIYRHLVQIRPSDGDVHFILGELYLRHGNLQGAHATYTRALEVQPSHAMAHFRLGQFEEPSGRMEFAIGRYREAIRANPDLGLIHEALSKALAATGDRKGAEHHAAEAQRLGSR
jgi:tetratricopeptide (TPR) repeat protein